MGRGGRNWVTGKDGRVLRYVIEQAEIALRDCWMKYGH